MEHRKPHHVTVEYGFPKVPADKEVSVTIAEVESAGALGAIAYPVRLAGATIYRAPIMEVPVAGAAKVGKKYKR